MVELMVAITIGLILTAGIIQIFVNSKQTYRIEDAMARVQESGRMALDSMANDIRMSNYWGCQANLANTTNDLNNANAGYIDFKGRGGIQGTGDSNSANPPNTITLRSADSSPGLTPQPNATATTFNQNTAAALRVTSNMPRTNDILLVSDCSGGDFFQVTGTAVDALGGFDINHAVGGTSPGNSAAAFAKVYQGDASIFYAHEITYYIATTGANSGQRTFDGQPALWRSVNGADQELVDDVTDLRILYGEDTNSDRSIDRYVTATVLNTTNYNNVYSVKIKITVQTPAANTSLTVGQRAQHDFWTTVAIRNRVL